jgi:hypothetical protein
MGSIIAQSSTTKAPNDTNYGLASGVLTLQVGDVVPGGVVARPVQGGRRVGIVPKVDRGMAPVRGKGRDGKDKVLGDTQLFGAVA